MTPIGDELRDALSSRAASLSPSPDPLAGIEVRARRIRRGRVAAAVAGTALAVSAVAVAVPALTPGRTSVHSQIAHDTSPAAETAPVPANALRRSPDEVGRQHPALDANVVRAWADHHPGEGAVYAVSLLSGHSETTPSLSYAIMELWRAGGPAYAVVAQDTTTTPVFVRDAVLADGAPFIDGVVSGRAAGSMIIYALPLGITHLTYDKGYFRSPYRPLGGFAVDPKADNTGNLERTGPVSAPDSLVATFTDGRVVREHVYADGNDSAPAAVPSFVAPTPLQTACCG